MHCQKHAGNSIACSLWTFMVALALAITTAPSTQAQTFKVLHNFTNGDDGSQPQSGLVMDGAGSLYGTTPYGGDTEDCSNREPGGGGVPPGCGVVYKVKKAGSGWIVQSLFLFGSKQQTITPYAGIPAIGPSGVLYGMTYLGGFGNFGNIYSLAPAPRAPVSVAAPWSYKLVYQFTSGTDSNNPSRLAPLLFDTEGDIYGAAAWGGLFNYGTVYELIRSGSLWTENILYSFTNGADGSHPSGIIFGHDGNIYGTALRGGGNQDCGFNYGCGTVFELTPSGSGWTETTLHVFHQGTDGGWPGPPIMDKEGNLYGLTIGFGPTTGGTVWELSPSNGGWSFSVLYSFPSQTADYYGPYPLTMDAAGNLYGITNWGGNNNYGFAFNLAPNGDGTWSYTDLHDFGADACVPQGAPVLDSAGNIYGVAEFCGPYDLGAVWEITP